MGRGLMLCEWITMPWRKLSVVTWLRLRVILLFSKVVPKTAGDVKAWSQLSVLGSLL